MRFCRGRLARLGIDDTGEIMERRVLRVLFQGRTDDGLGCREVVARQQRANLLQGLLGARCRCAAWPAGCGGASAIVVGSAPTNTEAAIIARAPLD